ARARRGAPPRRAAPFLRAGRGLLPRARHPRRAVGENPPDRREGRQLVLASARGGARARRPVAVERRHHGEAKGQGARRALSETPERPPVVPPVVLSVYPPGFASSRRTDAVRPARPRPPAMA